MLFNRAKNTSAHGAQSHWALMGTLGTKHEKSFKNRCPVPTVPTWCPHCLGTLGTSGAQRSPLRAL